MPTLAELARRKCAEKAKKPNPLAARARKKKAEQNGDPKLIGMELPKRNVDERNVWARKRQQQLEKTHNTSDKNDYYVGGLKICHVREHDGFWSVDVINGDVTYRFDNRAGSWMMNLGGGRFKEASFSIVAMVHERWMKELTRQGRKPGYLMHGQDHPAEKKVKPAKNAKERNTGVKPKKPAAWGGKKKSDSQKEEVSTSKTQPAKRGGKAQTPAARRRRRR